MLKGKRVLLGVTASIAAYKSAFLTRLLVKEGAEVKVVMTPSSVDFITPLTLSTLSKNPVFLEYFEGKTGEWNSHIELAEWADFILIAPLSANTMAKMAWGICDNLLLAVYLSARCPVFFAPAMDLEMFRQSSVKENIQTLESRGNILIPPGKGELASGLEGEGRMEEPELIVKQLNEWEDRGDDLSGKKILISAGPTQESLDPVRYITNHSSGKMGLAMVNEAYLRGAEITLVHGPIQLKLPDNINKIAVKSAEEMKTACLKEAKNADIIIMSAAVADYTPIQTSDQKIKKNDEELTVSFKKTTDILKEIGRSKNSHQILVGFALETENEAKNALNKLEKKNLDMIVLNSLQDKGAGFSGDQNKVTIFTRDKKEVKIPLKSKRSVARDILDQIKLQIK